MAKNKISKSFQEEFLDDLVKQAGFTPEEWELIKGDLRPILQERIMLQLYKSLPQEQVDKVWKFFEQEKYSELTDFLKKFIPNLEEFLMEIYAEFEYEYLENFWK